MAITYADSYNLTTATANFKRKYAAKSFNTYDAKYVISSQTKKTFNHSGSQFYGKVKLSAGGGKGSSTLPRASQPKYANPYFGRKSMYTRERIDREAIYAAKDEGAFDDSMREVAQNGSENFAWNIERCHFAAKGGTGSNLTGSGDLGTITVVSGSNPYTLTFGTTTVTFKEANFEVGDIVNIETGNTDEFEIQTVVPASYQITVERLPGGTQVPVATDHVFMQGSENTDIIGVRTVCDMVAGDTLYGIAHGHRWGPARVNASSAAISTARMNEVVRTIDDDLGMGTDLIVTSSIQWSKLSESAEDQKRYDVTKVMPKRQIDGHLGFSGLQYVGPRTVAPIVYTKFCEDDRMYFLNTSMMEMKHAKGFGWFDDDGVIFLREADSDSYEARYGGYMELWMPPTWHGVLYGLST